jgi:hypothetical protein
MYILSTNVCAGKTFDAFLKTYEALKQPLNLHGIEVTEGIPFTVDDIARIKDAGIDTVLWHDAFWYINGCKQETYPDAAANYFTLHKLFCSADIDVPIWSINPYKEEKSAAMWTGDVYYKFCTDNWHSLEYVLPRDKDPRSSYCDFIHTFRIAFKNTLPNAPLYNNVESILSTVGPSFCIDYSYVNAWCKGNREQSIVQCLLLTGNKTVEIHLSSSCNSYLDTDEWFMSYLDAIKAAKSLYITYNSLPIKYKQYG